MENLLNENNRLLKNSYNPSEIRRAIESVPSLWASTLNNEAALPISFEKRKYLIDIYNDFSAKQVLLKPPQIGASTMNTLKAIYVARFLKKDIIYTMPTDSIRDDFVTGTVNRIISQNESLMRWIDDRDSVERKIVGNNIIRLRGSWNPNQAMTVPASLLIHDEIDASNIDNITLYQTRQEAQEREEDKWRWYFSHPSIAGYGVDIYWQKSDKKEWVIVCSVCSKQQILTWPDSVDPVRECYQCKYCSEELSDYTRIHGEWKPTAIGDFSGFHVSQLMLYSKTAKDILNSFNDPNKNEQYFYNYVLGLPYVGSENKITSDVVLKNVVPEVNEQGDRIIIGVDTGLPIHFTCMNKQGAFYYGNCKTEDNLGRPQDPYDDLRKLLQRWPTSIIIADQGGDLIGIRKLQADYPGRVYLVFYRKDRKSKEMVEWGEKDELGTVRVDRNQYFQWMVEQLRDIGRIRLNGEVDEWNDWAKHFDNVYREIKVALDKPGKDVATNYGAELIWKRNGADHYCHTLLYCLVGLERYGTAQASFISRDTERFPMASRIDNSIPARRVLGKKITLVDF